MWILFSHFTDEDTEAGRVTQWPQGMWLICGRDWVPNKVAGLQCTCFVITAVQCLAIDTQ